MISSSKPTNPLDPARTPWRDGRYLPSPLEMVLAAHVNRRPGLSLAQFLRAAWPQVEPTTKLLWNWHLQALCDHVEAVLYREPGRPWTQNLVINVPPGSMKSLIVSVFAPAWVWLWRPDWRAIFASANPRVSLRDSIRCRDLIESDWYRDTFQVRWRMAEDQNAKGNFRNSAGGFRLAISVGSKVTGDRADALFFDDPLDAADAPSKTARDGVNFWWDQAFANRLADPVKGTRIGIMQRLHEEDLTGHLLEHEEWELLCLPMEFERAGVGAQKTFLGWQDPRAEEGALLFPERFPPSVLALERTRLGSAGYAGQMQQRPAPATGNRFKREWWRFWSASPEVKNRPQGASMVPPRVLSAKVKFENVLASWDCTFKDSDGSDFVVGIVVGVIGADRFVLERRRARMGFSETQREIRQQAREWAPWEILVEDKANGSAVIETLRAEIPGLIAVNPMGGKESRAAVLEPSVEAGNWYLPDGAEWLGDWIEEFASFPLGRHDDQVDVTSQAEIRLRGDSDDRTTRALLGLK